jgi:ribose-phosphate pyrophosphokinase
MRQDVRFHSGEAVSARYFAAMISQLFDALVTVDPHLHRIASLRDVFSIPARAISAAPAMGAWIKRSVPDAVIIGPDRESEQWASAVAEVAGAPYAVLSKNRRDDRSVAIEMPDLTRWRGRKLVIVDDIASTGGTLIEVAQRLTAAGFPKPSCVVVHALCGGPAEARLRSATDTFASTDTVPHSSNAISVATVIADALTGS